VPRTRSLCLHFRPGVRPDRCLGRLFVIHLRKFVCADIGRGALDSVAEVDVSTAKKRVNGARVDGRRPALKANPTPRRNPAARDTFATRRPELTSETD